MFTVRPAGSSLNQWIHLSKFKRINQRKLKKKRKVFSALLKGVLAQQIYYQLPGRRWTLGCGTLLPSMLKIEGEGFVSVAGSASGPNCCPGSCLVWSFREETDLSIERESERERRGEVSLVEIKSRGWADKPAALKHKLKFNQCVSWCLEVSHREGKQSRSLEVNRCFIFLSWNVLIGPKCL